MTPVDQPRVFVGVDGSLPSLRALRWGVWEARRTSGVVYAVHVRPGPSPERDVAFRDRARRLDEWLDRQAEGFLVGWVRDAFGDPPADVVIHPRVVTGRPGPALASLAWRDSDLIIVGADKHRRLLERSVSRYCVAHAECPVLVVPPDSFARTMRRASRGRGIRRRRDPWKHFDAAASDRRRAS